MQKLSSITSTLDVKASKLKWTTKPYGKKKTWTLQLNTIGWGLASNLEVSMLQWITKPIVEETTWTLQLDTIGWGSKQNELQFKIKI